MSKRYMFFIGTLCNGGAERVVSILASRMAEKGMDIEILKYYGAPNVYELHPKVKVTSVEELAGKTNKILNIFWLRKYFKENAKVVISFLAPFNMIAILSGLGLKVPVIAADRNDPSMVPFHPVSRKLRDFLYMFADYVVVQTMKNKNYFSKAVQNKCAVIYNPVNLGEYTGCALDQKKEKKIVTAGRLMPQKNHKMMISAFASIRKEYSDYQLIIYGDGPSREELENLTVKLGIQDHVSFPGNVSDLHERIKSSELFVMSSDYEGMPNALIEAMCMGLPVISTKVSGATDLIQHGKNGLLVEVGNEKDFTEALRSMLSNDEHRYEMAKEATKISANLMLDEVMKQWLEVIGDNIKNDK